MPFLLWPSLSSGLSNQALLLEEGKQGNPSKQRAKYILPLDWSSNLCTAQEFLFYVKLCLYVFSL